MVITTSSSQESSLIIDWNAILNANEQQQQPITSQDQHSTSKPPLPSPSPSPSPSPITNGFHFNVTQDAALGLLIEKIVLFEDTDKSGLFTPDKPRIEIDWSQIVWDLASKATYHKDDFLKTHLRMKTHHKYLNGNIWIKLAIPRDYKADRQKEVPHLKLSGQSISVVIMVDGIQAPAGFKNTRLAMTFVVVVQSPSNQVSLDADSKPLISDEYTPGVFRIRSLQFKSVPDPAPKAPEVEAQAPSLISDFDGKPISSALPVVDRENLGFLYWKEVAYTDRRKIISRTIDVSEQNHQNQTVLERLPNISQPFYQFFKYQPATGPKPNYTLYSFDLVFGKGDSTYGSTNFTDFSFVFGLGAAPQEPIFSFLVKATIFVCFCLPLIVMLTGLVYLMVRRFRRTGDTELLLAAES